MMVISKLWRRLSNEALYLNWDFSFVFGWINGRDISYGERCFASAGGMLDHFGMSECSRKSVFPHLWSSDFCFRDRFLSDNNYLGRYIDPIPEPKEPKIAVDSSKYRVLGVLYSGSFASLRDSFDLHVLFAIRSYQYYTIANRMVVLQKHGFA
jgi:hypothetical protein